MTIKNPQLIPIAQQWITRAREFDRQADAYGPDAPRRHDLELDASRLRMCAADLGSAHLADRAPEVTELVKRCVAIRWQPGADVGMVEVLFDWLEANGFSTITGEPQR